MYIFETFTLQCVGRSVLSFSKCSSVIIPNTISSCRTVNCVSEIRIRHTQCKYMCCMDIGFVVLCRSTSMMKRIHAARRIRFHGTYRVYWPKSFAAFDALVRTHSAGYVFDVNIKHTRQNFPDNTRHIGSDLLESLGTGQNVNLRPCISGRAA